MDVLERIKLEKFPENQYRKEETEKNAIYLHHTAGSSNPFAVLDWWESNEEDVSTSFVIAGPPPTGVTAWKDGDIIQAFSSKYWAFHLGGNAHLAPYRPKPKGGLSGTLLNKHSIGIELCGYGPVVLKEGVYRTVATNAKIAADKVVDLGMKYKGYQYWNKYTDAQIESTRLLLLYLAKRWNIPVEYKGDDQLFGVSARAFHGEPGIWTHASVRGDKFDCFPQPELIKMLRGLGC